MPEGEEVLIDVARRVVEAVQRRRQRPRPEPESLLEHRRRLELLVTAVFDVELPVRVAQPPAPPSFLRRLFGAPRWLIPRSALPATDGQQLFLPREVDGGGLVEPPRLFRLLALQQAGRARRGMAAIAAPTQGLEHELFLLSEAVAVDRELVGALPGLGDDLVNARRLALTTRPPKDPLSELERAAEDLYQRVLHQPIDEAGCVTEARTPTDSLDWAQETASHLSSRHPGRFRGLKSDLFRGVLKRADGHVQLGPGNDPGDRKKPRTGRLRRRPEVRDSEEESDSDPGPWMVQLDDPHEHVEDPMGLTRPVDRDAGQNPDDVADSLSELPAAQLVSTPDAAREVFVADDAPDRQTSRTPSGSGMGVVYPEWDYTRSSYRQRGATVWVRAAAEGDAGWAQRVANRRRALLNDVRHRFEGLRPRRLQLRRQLDGDEVDLDACVEAWADQRSGGAANDRLYRDTRALRRELAIHLLIDISGSTDAWIGEEQRIIDVEKEALLVCSHALEALGDPYAIDAFSGEGPHGVCVWSVKGYDEHDRSVVERRIAGLEPEHYTRAGAALRHATSQLAARKEHHRLLLLLSDGRPNDVDQYEGRYGIEDMHMAALEASSAGVWCFCLTFDRDAPRYIGKIFGPGRHATLSHPTQLPMALVEVLRQLIRR